jgi:nitrite reductase (NADH) large subunit
VCGVEAEFFEPYVEATPIPAAAGTQDWRCLNCSHIHAGSEPPDHCPVCDAPRDRFEAYDVEPVAQRAGGAGLRVVIAGAGITGVSAAEALRKSAPQAEILLLSREPDLPYYRLNLTRYLAGEVAADQLTLHPEEWYVDRKINLMLGGELKSIDAEGKRVVLQDGSVEDYDKLVLTAGAHAFVPPFPGTDRDRVSVLRTLADARGILGAARGGCRCVIIGGGILGLETAGALAQSGVEVTLVEGHGWLLPRQLNEPAGRLLEEYVRSVGISLRKSARTKELEGDEVVRSVRLEDGTALPADLVIITTGVRSNSYLARQAGLDVGRGVIVDNLLRTSQPDIYAAGDMAEHRGVSYGLWGPAQFQGTIAGMNAAGDSAEFAGIPRSNTLKVLGYDMFGIGQISAEDASSRAIDGAQNGRYYCFVFRDNHLVGSILMGDTALSSAVKKLIEGQVDCSGVLRGQPELERILDFLRDQS